MNPRRKLDSVILAGFFDIVWYMILSCETHVEEGQILMFRSQPYEVSFLGYLVC